MLLKVFILSLFLCKHSHGIIIDEDTFLSVRAWQSLNDNPELSDFPESKIPELLSKPNTAIAFSGGGSRAFIGSMGYLAALLKLDLLKNVRYIGGISGGAWATTAFSYVQNLKSDYEFLGPVLQPQEMTVDNLREMSPQCARSFASANVTFIAAQALLKGEVQTVADAWVYAISKAYLEPAGIAKNTPFTLNQAAVDDIKSRNPSLADQPFLLPADSLALGADSVGSRPYMLIGTSLEGPVSSGPYNAEAQNYTMIEITPLYVGQQRDLDVQHTNSLGLTRSRHVGGAIESFAFSVAGSSSSAALSAGTGSDLLKVRVAANSQLLDLAHAAGASSYAPGALLTSLPAKLSSALGLTMQYWSPSSTGTAPTQNSNGVVTSTESYFCDGGSYENMPVINFLQRKVERIVLFYTSVVPLQPSTKWDPFTEPFTSDKLTDDMAALFGVFDSNQAGWYNRSYEVERNQVFASSDFAPVVAALQAAQQVGKGIITTATLTTVSNTWWGIPAGFKASVTFAYLGRLSRWEQRLRPELKELLVPHNVEDAEDLSKDISHGPFRNFPHYFTAGGEINAERANVLADLTAWSVLQNADVFRSVLS